MSSQGSRRQAETYQQPEGCAGLRSFFSLMFSQGEGYSIIQHIKKASKFFIYPEAFFSASRCS
jgi:hypothetical protein